MPNVGNIPPPEAAASVVAAEVPASSNLVIENLNGIQESVNSYSGKPITRNENILETHARSNLEKQALLPASALVPSPEAAEQLKVAEQLKASEAAERLKKEAERVAAEQEAERVAEATKQEAARVAEAERLKAEENAEAARQAEANAEAARLKAEENAEKARLAAEQEAARVAAAKVAKEAAEAASVAAIAATEARKSADHVYDLYTPTMAIIDSKRNINSPANEQKEQDPGLFNEFAEASSAAEAAANASNIAEATAKAAANAQNAQKASIARNVTFEQRDIALAAAKKAKEAEEKAIQKNAQKEEELLKKKNAQAAEAAEREAREAEREAREAAEREAREAREAAEREAEREAAIKAAEAARKSADAEKERLRLAEAALAAEVVKRTLNPVKDTRNKFEDEKTEELLNRVQPEIQSYEILSVNNLNRSCNDNEFRKSNVNISKLIYKNVHFIYETARNLHKYYIKKGITIPDELTIILDNYNILNISYRPLMSEIETTKTHFGICKQLYNIYRKNIELIRNIEPTKKKLKELQENLYLQYKIIQQQQIHTDMYAKPIGPASAAAAPIRPASAAAAPIGLAKKIVQNVLSKTKIQKRINDANTQLNRLNIFFKNIDQNLINLQKINLDKQDIRFKTINELRNFTIDPEKHLYVVFNEFYNIFLPIYNSYKKNTSKSDTINKNILNELQIISNKINLCPVTPVPPESYTYLLKAIDQSRPNSAKKSLTVRKGGKSRKQKIHRRRSHKKQKTKRRRSHKRTSK